MVSLREQMLKAGLVDKKKVAKAHQEKTAQKKEEKRTGTVAVDEAREAALEMQRKNAERARELNAQRDAAAQQKAIAAQITQLITQNKQAKDQSRGKGGRGRDETSPYNFTYGTKIERIYVSEAVREYLVAGRLVIVAQGENFELVPRIVADKIAERNAVLREVAVIR
jgi:uncharacterized protein YaiL (DUF2058 family)